MKVTALIDDKLVQEVKEFSGGKNITESLVIALDYFVRQKKLDKVNEEIEANPLEFRDEFIAFQNRKLNRNR